MVHETNTNIDYDMRMAKIKEGVLKGLRDYEKSIRHMSCDAPIEVLCLPKPIEAALLRAGCLRIYDLLDRDFTEIKGIGKARIGELTARFDQFLSML